MKCRYFAIALQTIYSSFYTQTRPKRFTFRRKTRSALICLHSRNILIGSTPLPDQNRYIYSIMRSFYLVPAGARTFQRVQQRTFPFSVSFYLAASVPRTTAQNFVSTLNVVFPARPHPFLLQSVARRGSTLRHALIAPFSSETVYHYRHSTAAPNLFSFSYLGLDLLAFSWFYLWTFSSHYILPCQFVLDKLFFRLSNTRNVDTLPLCC